MGNEHTSRRKALYLLLSLLVAAVMWIFVDNTSNNGSPRVIERELKDLPIEYMNEAVLAERGLMLLPEDTDTSVDLTLTGSRWNFGRLDKDEIRVQANLLDVVEVGKQRLSLAIYFPDALQGKFTKKGTGQMMATVNIAELYHKTVEVRCELTGNVAEGYTAGQLQLSHTEIEIRGQREDIDPVSYVKATLDLGENAETSVSATLEYQFCDKGGQVIDNSDGRIHATVDAITATLPVSVTKELTLVVNFIESAGVRTENLNADIQPSTIMVSGDASRLKNVNTIKLGDLDLLTLENGVGTYTFPITVPQDCQNLSGVTRATLTVSFKDMDRRTFPVNRFRFENVPEGKTAAPVTAETEVKLFGTSEDLDAITEEQLTLVADMSDFSAVTGTYTVPVTLEVASGGDIGVDGEYQIQVTLRESGPEEPPEPGEDAPAPEEQDANTEE